jgi:hypothetical protein
MDKPMNQQVNYIDILYRSFNLIHFYLNIETDEALFLRKRKQILSEKKKIILPRNIRMRLENSFNKSNRETPPEHDDFDKCDAKKFDFSQEASSTHYSQRTNSSISSKLSKTQPTP